jgi:hypothetical protein
MKGFLTRGETFTLKAVTYFVQNSIRSDGNELDFIWKEDILKV